MIDPIGLLLIHQISEAIDDVNAFMTVPLEIRAGIGFGEGFRRRGVRDDAVRSFARHLTFIPCEGLDTKAYEAARWPMRDVEAHALARKALALYKDYTP
jgi:hypothetical protein